MGWLKGVADALGGPEDGLRLMAGLMAGYPIMFLHRMAVCKSSSTNQHLYFFLTGLLVGFSVLATDVVHSLYQVFGTYLILLITGLLGGGLKTVLISFLFNFGYLMTGYWYTESNDYDINWTMPGCILCLRLIGLSFDIYDGGRAREEGEAVLSKDQQKVALEEAPSLLEMLSHSFFIGGYFVGPQFSFKKFKNYARPEYMPTLPESPVPYGLRRLALAVLYLSIHSLGSMYIPANWPITQEYVESGFLIKMLKYPLWCRFILYKYLMVWLISEGVCIISGLSFNGVREDGRVDWKGCANVKLVRLETASRFGHLIEAFNINTNDWAAAYIYKRLKFMNNRHISQGCTLVFLALWHGFHLGYFVTFFNEFMTMNVEKELMSILERSERMKRWQQHPACDSVCKLIGWLWVSLFMPFCFIPFSLMTADRFLPAYKGTYFLIYLVYLSWPLYRPALKAFLQVKPKPDKKKE